MHMECEKFEKMIPDYDWLDNEDRQELDLHAEKCMKCREKIKAIEILGKVIFEGDENMKNPDFSARIMSQIKKEKSFSILPYVAMFVVVETMILVLLDPRLRDTVNFILSAVGISEEYLSVIGDFFSSSIPYDYDFSLAGYLNFEMMLITIFVGIIIFSPAVRIFDDRRVNK